MSETAQRCPHPPMHRDVYRNNGRLFIWCRACDSDLSFHDLIERPATHPPETEL